MPSWWRARRSPASAATRSLSCFMDGAPASTRANPSCERALRATSDVARFAGNASSSRSASSLAPARTSARIRSSLSSGLSGVAATAARASASSSSGLSSAAGAGSASSAIGSTPSRCGASSARIADSGCAPTKPSIGRPSRTSSTVGSERTPNSAGSCMSSSVFTFASSTRPPSSATSFSSTGPSCLHGPHHGAQKSISTGTCIDAARTFSSKSAWVTSKTN